MGTITAGLARLIRSLDQFSNSQFVHYGGSESYNTLTGGCFSLMIMAVILTLGIKELILLVNKETIISSTMLENEATPSGLNITLSKASSFMFAVSFTVYSTSNSLRDHFAVGAWVRSNLSNVRFFHLQNCTRDHFAFNDKTLEVFDRLGLGQSALCPPLNVSLLLGIWQQQNFLLQLEVNRCIGTPCVEQQTFNQTMANAYQLTTMSIPFINTVINPMSKDFRETYVDNQNYFFISHSARPFAEAYVSESTITVDSAIFPTQQESTESIINIPSPFTYKQLPAQYSNAIYAKMYFKKSPQKFSYKQSFTKIDTVISYVGGLASSIISLFFLLRWYAGTASLISISQKIFRYNQHSEIESKRFNFWEYMKMGVKGVLEKSGGEGEWEGAEMFKESEAEMAEQVSIELILERLAYCEAAISVLLTKDQLQALFLIERKSLADAALARKYLLTSNRYFFDSDFNRKDTSTNQNQGGGPILEKGQKMKDLQQACQIQLKDSIKNPIVYLSSSKCLEIEEIEEIEESNQEAADGGKSAEIQQNASRVEQNEDSQMESSKLERQTILAQMKAHMLCIIEQAQRGENTSLRIARRLSSKVIAEMGLKDTIEKLEGSRSPQDAAA